MSITGTGTRISYASATLAQKTGLANQIGTPIISLFAGNIGDLLVVSAATPVDTDVSLDNGVLTVTDSSNGDADDDLTISLVNGGADLQISDPSHILGAGAGVTQVDPNTVTVAASTVTAGATFDLLAGDDRLTVDFSGGDPIAAVGTGGINLMGGIGVDDLVLTGGSVTDATYGFTNSTDGTVDLISCVIGSSPVYVISEPSINPLQYIEVSHVLGLDGLDPTSHAGDLMAARLTAGTQRLPLGVAAQSLTTLDIARPVAEQTRLVDDLLSDNSWWASRTRPTLHLTARTRDLFTTTERNSLLAGERDNALSLLADSLSENLDDVMTHRRLFSDLTTRQRLEREKLDKLVANADELLATFDEKLLD